MEKYKFIIIRQNQDELVDGKPGYRVYNNKSGGCDKGFQEIKEYSHHDVDYKYHPLSYISQIIVGAETGKNARPCKTEWIRSVVEQARSAGVPCFVKAINLNGKITSDINKFPESLRVRELAWRL